MFCDRKLKYTRMGTILRNVGSGGVKKDETLPKFSWRPAAVYIMWKLWNLLEFRRSSVSLNGLGMVMSVCCSKFLKVIKCIAFVISFLIIVVK